MKADIDEKEVVRRGSKLVKELRHRCLNGKSRVHIADFPHKNQRSGSYLLSHLFREMFLQVKGKTIFAFADREVTVESGDICFIPSFALHGEKAVTDDNGEFENLVIDMQYEDLWLHFGGIKKGTTPVMVSERPLFAFPGGAKILDYIDSTLKNFIDHNLNSEEIIRSIIATLLTHLEIALQSPPIKSSENRLIKQCCELIHQKLSRTDLTVHQIAELCNCSEGHLSRLFRQNRGRTIIAYITEKRLEKAQLMLKETDFRINEIAWACGYSDPNYFSRIFKESFGITARKFRLNNQSN